MGYSGRGQNFGALCTPFCPRFAQPAPLLYFIFHRHCTCTCTMYGLTLMYITCTVLDNKNLHSVCVEWPLCVPMQYIKLKVLFMIHCHPFLKATFYFSSIFSFLFSFLTLDCCYWKYYHTMSQLSLTKEKECGIRMILSQVLVAQCRFRISGLGSLSPWESSEPRSEDYIRSRSPFEVFQYLSTRQPA